MVSLGCGTNDFNGGRTTAAVIADIQNWVAEVKADAPNSKVEVNTVQDRGSMSSNAGYAWKSTVNTAIKAIAGISVIDLGADADLGCDGCATNTMWFNTDQIHFSGTNGVPPDAQNNGINRQANTLVLPVMQADGIQ